MDKNKEWKWSILDPHMKGDKEVIAHDWVANEASAKQQGYTKMHTIKYQNNRYFLNCMIQDFNMIPPRTWYYKIEPNCDTLIKV